MRLLWDWQREGMGITDGAWERNENEIWLNLGAEWEQE